MVIYKIQNLINDKCYIGQTIQSPEFRWSSGHVSKLNLNKHNNEKLQRAWNKYGKEAFQFSVIYEAQSLEELNDKETYYMALYDSIINGYNIKEGGSNKRQSESTKYKISQKQIQYNKTLTKEQIHCKMSHMSRSRNRKSLQSMAEKQRARFTSEYKEYWSDKFSSSKIFVNPNNEIVEIKNLSRFCKDHQLEYTCMIRVYNGIRKHHKGWRRLPKND